MKNKITINTPLSLWGYGKNSTTRILTSRDSVRLEMKAAAKIPAKRKAYRIE